MVKNMSRQMHKRVSQAHSLSSLKSQKKGVSTLIEYVLLLAMAVVMGTIVYAWVHSYIPTEELQCSDGVSLYVDSYLYQCNTKNLTLNLSNNGRFDVAGYFIKATNSTAIELATIDLSSFTNGSQEGAVMIPGGGVSQNPLDADAKTQQKFNISTAIGNVTSIEIIPVRYEEVNNKYRLLSCTNAKIVQEIKCHSGTSEFKAEYLNLESKNQGSRPPGVPVGTNWWYYDVKLSEIGNIIGITVNTRQACTQSEALGYSCDSNKTDIVEKFGTNRINSGGSIIRQDIYIYTTSSSMNATEYFWGVDDNGHNVATNYSISVS